MTNNFLIVSLNDLKETENRRKQINACPMEDITWVLNGKPWSLSAKLIENIKVGKLLNTDILNFIEDEAFN
jgi:hypothetical protein